VGAVSLEDTNEEVDKLSRVVSAAMSARKLDRGTMPQAGRSPVRFPMRLLDFSLDLIFPAALWPWIDSTSNRNEYQEYS
jgi:hypothetical protein